MKKNRIMVILLLSACAFLGFSADKSIQPALLSIFEAERAFAKRCGEVGIRASFLEFFAEDGVAFYPQPVKYKEAVKDRPAPQNPLAYALKWEPIFGDVAAAGDLGYDTGPSVFTDNTNKENPPGHGFFFSVWKKQTDGSWKVALDIGTDTGTPYSGSREAQSARAVSKMTAAKVNVDAERAALMEAERAFSKMSEQEGLAKAYAQHLNVEARLHRDGLFPLTERAEILAYLSKKDFNQTNEVIFSEASQSGDLGYTYGSYAPAVAKSPATSSEKGYYARVWKKDQANQWTIVADIVKPAPPAQQ